MPTRGEHWETIYRSKSDPELSWTQAEPRTSLALVREFCPRGRVIDIGAGNSVLTDRLLDGGYSVTALDISPAAVDRLRQRLANKAEAARFIVADVTSVGEIGTFDVWHDRAVFHFLTEPADRARYVSLMTRSLAPGGHAIIATFAPDGPPQCSGLDVRRYDGASLGVELGHAFELLKSLPEIHLTPWNKPQSFQYSVFRRV
jgi:SAM-dependent methyltransferase